MTRDNITPPSPSAPKPPELITLSVFTTTFNETKKATVRVDAIVSVREQQRYLNGGNWSFTRVSLSTGEHLDVNERHDRILALMEGRA